MSRDDERYLLDISMQKYTKRIIFHQKIFPSKFSSYSPSTFYYLNFDLYHLLEKFSLEIFRDSKTHFLVYSCILNLNMIVIFHKNQLLTIKILKNYPFFCLIDSVYSEVWIPIIKITIFFRLLFYSLVDRMEIHSW